MKIFLTLIMSKLYETWDSNKIESWFISWEAKTLNKEQKKVLSFKVWRCTSTLAWDVSPEVETWDSEQVRELILHSVRWKLYNRNKSRSEAIQFGELYSGLILYFIYISTRAMDAQSWKFENQSKVESRYCGEVKTFSLNKSRSDAIKFQDFCPYGDLYFLSFSERNITIQRWKLATRNKFRAVAMKF